MNSVLEPLIFPEKEEKLDQLNSLCKCLCCEQVFDLNSSSDEFLGHLLIQHKLVIADIKEVVNLKGYVEYWRLRFQNAALREFCFTMSVKTEDDATEDYFMLAQELPEDKNLREKLQQERLNLVIKQQQKERNDNKFSHCCLFCRKTYQGNRKLLFDHMNFDHNFSVGLPDNLVFVEEFLKILDSKLTKNICLYCEKTFKDRNVLKEHMRKKQHKKINPQNKEYDKFYIVNYLEPGKTWKEIMEEYDDTLQNEDWSDWHEPQSEAVCLFCDFHTKDREILFQHISSHNFDFQNLTNNFSFYQQIKIVNYIRRQIHGLKCIDCDWQAENCESLMSHMADLKHYCLPNSSVWDQAQYYFPTYENDVLLCWLEDDGNGQREEVAVIPEDPVVEPFSLCDSACQELLSK